MNPIANAFVNGSGTTLTLSFGSGYNSPTVTAIPGPAPTFRVNGGAAQQAGLAVWVNPADENGETSPCVTYLLPVTIHTGDTVTVSLAAGAITTSAGASDALTNFACTNLAGGGSPLSTSLQERQMKIGAMTWQSRYWEPVNMLANWVKGATPGWSDDTLGFSGMASNGWTEEGMPANPGTHQYDKIVTMPGVDEVTVGSYPVAPAGTWTLLWDGPGYLRLNINGQPWDTDDVSQRIVGQATNNRKVYPDVPWNPGQRSVLIGLSMVGEVRNIRVFDKYVTNPLNPPKLHPKAMEKLRGIGIFRAKDALSIDNGCPTVEFSDHTPASTASYLDQPYQFGTAVKITRFDPYNNAAYVRGGEQGIKVTCATPHSLKSGTFVDMIFPENGQPSFSRPIVHDGATENVFWQNVMVWVISPTEFVVVGWWSGPITPQVLPAGSEVWRKRAGMAFGDVIDLCNELSCDCWISIPHAASDQYTQDMTAYVAQHLRPGLKFWIEYSNEPWNGAGPYPQYQYFYRMAREFALSHPAWTNEDMALSIQRWYVMRAAQHRQIAKAQWLASGRSTSDWGGLILNGMFSNRTWSLALAHNCADWCDIQGRRPGEAGYAGPIPYEVTSIAPYQQMFPYYGTLTGSQFDSLTVEQVMDINDAFMYGLRSTSMGKLIQEHAAGVATIRAEAKTPERANLKFFCYEDGPTAMGLGGPGQHLRAIAWWGHPRSRGQMAEHYRLLNENGISHCVNNGPFGLFGVENGVGKANATYTGFEQVDGDGMANLPYLTDANGKAVRMDLALVTQSVQGKLIHDWNGASGVPPPPANTSAVQFIRADASTQGGWKGVYGADGYDIAQDTSAGNPRFPSYATVSKAGQEDFTWASSTADLRGLQKVGGVDRLAACWFSGTSFEIVIHCTDGQFHQLALYMVDWDRLNRSATIEVQDPSGFLLDTRTVSNYAEGQYLIWKVRGHVVVRVTNVSNNAVVNGLFFDPPNGTFVSSPPVSVAMMMGA